MSIRAIIWDLGGVLVRTDDIASRERLAQRLGKTRLELEDLVFSSESGRRAQLGQLTDAQHWKNVRMAVGLTPHAFKDFQKEFWGGDYLDSLLIEYIRNLRPIYRTGLLSNNFPGLRRAIRDRWKIEDAFDTVVISSEVGLLKPDVRIYEMAISALDVLPNQAIFIDDFSHNLIGAEAAGLRTIQFRNTAQTLVDLQKMLERTDYDY